MTCIMWRPQRSLIYDSAHEFKQQDVMRYEAEVRLYIGTIETIGSNYVKKAHWLARRSA
jgi:hypothetical protein